MAQMNRRNIKYAVIFLLVFLLMGAAQTVLAGYFFEVGLSKRILNFVVFPLQVLQLAFLFLAMTYSGKSEFSRDSIWFSERNRYHPVFVSARTFDARPYFLIFLIFILLGSFMDWRMGAYPEHYIWILNNLIILIFVPIVSRWIGIFLKKLEKAVNDINPLFEKEKEYAQYRINLKKHIFSRKEIIPMFLIITAIKINEIIFPDYTWISAGGYNYPLVPLWWSLAAVPIWNFVYVILASISHSYYQFSRSLSHLIEVDKIKIYLFHPDGCSGMKSIVDFVTWLSGRLLILVAIGSFAWYVVISYFPQEISLTGCVGFVLIVDAFSLLVLLVPLMTLRKLIKRKKEQEKRVIMDKIRQKEEIITKEGKRNISRDLDDLRSLFMLLDKINSVNEWLIGRKIKIDLGLKIFLGFNPLIFELLRAILS